MGRSAENQRVGIVTIAAWQMEERADQKMSAGRLPDSINGRVRVHHCHAFFRSSFGFSEPKKVTIYLDEPSDNST